MRESRANKHLHCPINVIFQSDVSIPRRLTHRHRQRRPDLDRQSPVLLRPLRRNPRHPVCNPNMPNARPSVNGRCATAIQLFESRPFPVALRVRTRRQSVARELTPFSVNVPVVSTITVSFYPADAPAIDASRFRHRRAPSRPTACQYRINIPQKCRLKYPHFGLPAMPSVASPTARGSGFDVPVTAGRIAASYPGLSGQRLWREIAELGYAGGYTAITDFPARGAPAVAGRFCAGQNLPTVLPCQIADGGGTNLFFQLINARRSTAHGRDGRDRVSRA